MITILTRKVSEYQSHIINTRVSAFFFRMVVGEKLELYIPSDLAYGKKKTNCCVSLNRVVVFNAALLWWFFLILR